MIENKVIEKVGIIYLNRPYKINALNLSMIDQIYHILKSWESDKNINVVLCDSLSSKGFSAGGDLKEIYYDYLINNNCKDKALLFKKEYDLDKYIKSYSKPIISHWHGIVMGGGVGLSINSDLIVCEKTTNWAMPETSLGFVPDVGVQKYISNLPQALGQYIGLCSVSLNSYDLIKYDLADIELSQIAYEKFLKTLYKLSNTYAGEDLINQLKNQLEKTNNILKDSYIQNNMEKIEKYFSLSSMEEIFNKLNSNLNDEFARKTYENLSYKDPFILTLQFEKYFVCKELTYEQTIDLDLKIVQYAITTKSINEGIRSKIIDKDNNPNWPVQNFNQINETDIKNLLDIKKLYKDI